jgi:acetoin utilization deacetylase AcuC-like enzyme
MADTATLKVFYSDGYAAPIGDHVRPIRKFGLVAHAVRPLPWVEMLEPRPLTPEDLLRVHTSAYVEAVRTGEPRALAESQKFPWSPALYPSVCLTGGGVLAAAEAALHDGIATATVSGFHHAHADHGEGFCTFNGLVVALEALHARGAIRTAAVLDMDLHYGNGTAALAAARPWLRALSIYGSDYWLNQAFNDVRVQRHHDGPNHRAVALPNGCNGAHLAATVERELPWLVADGKPDVVIYQAGADPYREDPYSPLDLGFEDLQARDRQVFAFAKAQGLPLAWVLAGGYTKDTSKVVKVHVNTYHACREVYGLHAAP